MSNQQVVDLMEHVWSSIDSLCSRITEAQWKTPTDCPGWSVQDQVSHLVGAESGILGNPRPDHTPGDTSYVKNDIGQSNEWWWTSAGPGPAGRCWTSFGS